MVVKVFNHFIKKSVINFNKRKSLIVLLKTWYIFSFGGNIENMVLTVAKRNEYE